MINISNLKNRQNSFRENVPVHKLDQTLYHQDPLHMDPTCERSTILSNTCPRWFEDIPNDRFVCWEKI